MMELTTTASFFILLFGTTAAMNNGHDEMTNYNIETVLLNGDLSTSCFFGVKSVSIVLYTSDLSQGQAVEIDKSCNLINPSKVIFLTHGFIADAYAYNFSILASVLIKANYTVFSLDWSNASCYHDPAIINLLGYPSAVYSTREIGVYLANYTKLLIDTCRVPLKNITFMGHSLGAHISGFAAKNLQNSNYGKIPLLIGTDPALPLFMYNNCNNRICISDAERVEVLHTSILGIPKSLGHLDLWFDNGITQPACSLVTGTACSHNIVIDYVINMFLNNCVYEAVPISKRTVSIPRVPGCSSKINRTFIDNEIFNSNYTEIGDYCVFVSSKYPYCTMNDIFYQE